MTNVTQILGQIESGDISASEQLLPLVYEELRKLAAVKLAQEKPGQTLQATALVHEAYVRLVDGNSAQHWNSRGHFFAAAAEAMRRILIMNARRRCAEKRGGGRGQIELDPSLLPDAERDERLVALDEALTRLEQQHPEKARLVKLRFFAGLTIADAGAEDHRLRRRQGHRSKAHRTHDVHRVRPAHRHVRRHEPRTSPFQPLDVDTRSDIYSLGVLLYEVKGSARPSSRPFWSVQFGRNPL